MALIKCPYCGTMVDDQGGTCFACGGALPRNVPPQQQIPSQQPMPPRQPVPPSAGQAPPQQMPPRQPAAGQAPPQPPVPPGGSVPPYNQPPKKKKGKAWIIILVIFVILFLILLLTFCGSDEDEYTEEASEEEIREEETDFEESPEEESVQKEDVGVQGESTWTVMVYLCGTDLESENECATGNLMEMAGAQKTDQVNVIVETGGTKKWALASGTYDDFTGIDPDVLSFYHVQNENLVLDKTEPLANMGDPATLRDFITWGKNTYPADRYMLILWDHGGGTTGGVCYDELHNDDAIYLDELKQAITEADVPLEAVGFDACLMGSLETAQSLQGYAHYMIASEETEPGSGWDYYDFLERLSNEPRADGLTLGKWIVDGFLEKCRMEGTDSLATLSVTDVTKIPALTAAFHSLSAELLLTTQDTEKFREISQGVMKAENYGGNTESAGYSNQVDLGDLVAKTEGVLTQNASSVTQALRDAVQYEAHGRNREHSNGLSLFYPLSPDEDEIDLFKEKYTENVAYLEYISILGGNWDSLEWEKAWEDAWKEAYEKPQTSEGKYDSYFNGSASQSQQSEPQETQPVLSQEVYEAVSEITPIQQENYQIKIQQESTDDGYLKLKIVSGLEAVSSVCFELFYEDSESGSYLYLGSDDDVYGDYETGEFQDNFAGEWKAIGDEFVYAELTAQNEDYNLYSIPILLNGEEMNMTASYDFNTSKYTILSVSDGMDEETGFSGRDIRQLKNGDKIEFLFYVYGEDSEEPEAVPLGEITWNDNIVMEDAAMEDGRFLYRFRVDDFFGNSTWGDAVYMEIKDGEIYEYEP